jgi:hypothetical protein
LLTVGVPLWSEVQKVLGADEARRAAEIKVFDEIAEAWAKLPPEGCDPPKAAVGAVREIDALAQALQRNSDILCANDGSSRQRWALPARYIVRDAQNSATCSRAESATQLLAPAGICGGAEGRVARWRLPAGREPA